MVGRLRLYQRIIVVRREPGFIESDDRQSLARCSTYSQATAVHISHHDCSSLDALSAPNSRVRRLQDNLRRYQDRLGTWDNPRQSVPVSEGIQDPLGTCRRLQESLRRGQYHPVEDTQTLYDGTRES
ncbi:hypothetical protein DPMN_020453 [Dreissena polymorpha]|uniref:Uncharacterized protein n=1 Tax=Dreissena polymorpha TaxID=45954 RepID=A0A9D4SA79_DREPO|nr:hypothetical protein DPMN_020453 [Dreissena polymorpha]